MTAGRISFFTSPIGLGHATRDAAISSRLGDLCEISFTTGGAAARLLANSGERVRDAYSPPGFDTGETGRLRNPALWLWRYYRYYQNCKRIACKVIESERPDVVVSDEDFASLAIAQDAGIPTVLVTDILHTRFAARWPATSIEARMNRSMHGIIKRCHSVIMPDDGPDGAEGPATGGLIDYANNIARVGPITRQFTKTRDEARRVHGFGKKTILVAVGGTDAGKFLIDRSLEAAARLRREADVVVVSGPSISAKGRGGARMLGYVDNLHELILAADVLVSLAGRSTIDEAAAAGTPAIFIPIAGHFEQEDNAARCGFSAGDADRLEELIASRLARPRPAPQDPAACDGGGSGGNGAEKAARIIASIIT